MRMASKISSNDLAVQATNDDATACKRFAVQRGYWRDDFIQHFCRSVEKKSPEISRGYYARVKSIRVITEHFIKLTRRKCQVVSFGAGFDTQYWTLHAASMQPQLYVEVDFDSVVTRKCQYIKTKQPLLDALQEPTVGKNELHSLHYHLIPGDLRNMSHLGDQLLSTGLDTSLPTLFLAECVLVYMEPEKSKEVVQWAGANFTTALFVNYDPIHPHDKFGKIMQDNLKARGCSLLGIDTYHDLDSQKKRYISSGWEGAWSLDMAAVYSLLPQEEVKRIEQLDFLDEKELLTQLLQHYCLTCGYRDQLRLGLEKIQLGET